MKKVLNVVLTIAVLVQTSGLAIAHAENRYIKNFKQIATYNEGKFSDVGEEWYKNSVESAYELGLMKGISDIEFNPKGQLSNAEAVTIASRIHKIYNTGKDDFSSSIPWYQTYLDYAVANGICEDNFNPNDKATRAFFIGIFANAIDSSVLTIKNDIKDGSLWDVKGWYQDAVYKMYRAGILSGNDKYGTFAPNSNITRAEVSAIAVRAVEPSSRISVSIAERPIYTVDINLEGNNLYSFEQRAIVANLKWILNGEPQGEEWQNDVYREEITVTEKVLDTAILPLPQVVVYPVYYSMIVDGNTEWEVDGKKYFIELDQDGIIDFGDGDPLVWGVPNEVICKYEIVQHQEEKIYTYSDYTQKAQKMINDLKPKMEPNEEKIKALVSETVGDIGEYKYVYDTLYAGEGIYSIYGDSHKLSYPSDDEYKKWLDEHNDRYIIAVYPITSGMFSNSGIVLMELNGYAQKDRNITAKSWKYDSQGLSIEWNDGIEITNPVVNKEFLKYRAYINKNGLEDNLSSYELYDKEENQLAGYEIEKDEEGEFFAKIDGYAKLHIDSSAGYGYYLEGNENYKFGFESSWTEGVYSIKHRSSSHLPIIRIKINSREATVQADIWSTEQKISIPEPKEIAGDIYLPLEIIEVINLWKTAYEDFAEETGMDSKENRSYDRFLAEMSIEEILKEYIKK